MQYRSFEARRDAVHEGILRGHVGCGFGSAAARKGHIQYVQVPDAGAPNDEYAQAVTDFACSDATILIGIASQDPENYDLGRQRAYDMYHSTLLATCRAGRGMIAQLLSYRDEMGAEAAAELEQVDREYAMREKLGPIWLTSAENQLLMDENFMVEGPVALSLLHIQTTSFRRLMAFAMGPYYIPVKEGFAHPRFSPHMAIVLNYTQDVIDVQDRTREIDAIRAWLRQAVGYRYKQGFHIPQIPTPDMRAAEHR